MWSSIRFRYASYPLKLILGIEIEMLLLSYEFVFDPADLSL